MAAATSGAAAGVIGVGVYSGLSEDGRVPMDTAGQTPPSVSASPAFPAEPGIYRESLTQTGRLAAITDASATAESSDGTTQTYFVTPETTTVTGAADGEKRTIRVQFEINEIVTITATVVDGRATATAVADRDGVNPDGPPMDYGIPRSS